MLRAALLVTVLLLTGAAPADAAGKLAYSYRECALWAPTAVPDPCPRVIVVAREDGTGARQITNAAAPGEVTYGGDLDPGWAPDGRSIVFTRMIHRPPLDPAQVWNNRGSELWVMNADGSGQRPLLAPEDTLRFRWQSRPMWTAGGARVVFMAGGGDEPPRLYSVALDGTDLRPITPAGEHVVGPAVTPDGDVTHMTLALYRAGSQAPFGIESTIWRTDPETGRREQIFFGDIQLAFAAVSPAGRWMALFTARAGLYRIQTLGLDGSGLVDRADAMDYRGRFEWGGPERLLLTRYVGTPGEERGELWALDLDRGDEPHRMIEDFAGEDYDWHPGTAPDPALADELPPVVITEPPARPAAAARVRKLARIPLIAADGTGLARVEASLARVVESGCRAATPSGRLGPARSCRRPRWRTVNGIADWRRLTDPLPRGTYLLRVRARDTEGNRTRGGKVRRLRLSSAPRQGVTPPP